MKFIPLKTIKNVLILRTDRIGEVLLSTVLVDALKTHIPGVNVSYVTSALARDVLAYKAGIKAITTFDTSRKDIPFCEIWALARQFRRGQFDMVFIVNPNRVLHVAAFLAGIRYRIGFDKKWPYFLTHRIPDMHHDGQRHEIEYTLELLTPLGIHDAYSRPVLSVPDEDIRAVRQFLSVRNVDFQKKIFIAHPGSNFIFKRWPKEYFLEVIKSVVRTTDVNILLTGTENERQLCDDIASVFPQKILNLAGELTLKQFAALLKIADLVLCNDSGPMHMAYCLGTRVATIFGRGTRGAGPTRWAPRGENVLVFNKPSGCTDCDNELCPYNFRCLKLVKPDEVVDKILPYLE